MTTIERDHAFTVYCAGRSCRELYYMACRHRQIRCNAFMLHGLESVPNEFAMSEISATANYLGPLGVDSLMDVVRANRMLCALRLQDVGANDANVAALVDALQGHERFFELDLSDNKDITDASANNFFILLSKCKMLSHVNLSGTFVSKAIRRKLSQLGHRNQMLEANFFRQNYSSLKRLFIQLDSTGSGRISFESLLEHIRIPQVAAALERRFTLLDFGESGKSYDGYIDMGEFLYFTYPAFKSLTWLQRHMHRVDQDEEHVVQNWRLISEAFTKARVTYTQWHVARIYHRALTPEEAQAFVTQAVECEFQRKGTEPVYEGLLVVEGPSAAEAINLLYAEEVEALKARRKQEWETFRLAPTLVKAMSAAFGPICSSTGKETEAELGALLTRDVELPSQRLHLSVAAARLRAAGLGPSITVSFAEWCTFINENSAWIVFPAYNPVL